MKIFSIRDARAEGYNRPFFALTRAMAIREIQAGLSEDIPMAKFASDFSIWEIGSFDSSTGHVEGCEPHHLIEVGELVDVKEEPPGAGV